MPQKSKGADGYKTFTDSLAAGRIGRFYIFHGEERYLLQRSLGELRKRLCPDGLDSFNYKRYEDKGFSAAGLEDAIETMPAFADRTLIEIHDFDVFKNSEKQRFLDAFKSLPDYVCLVLVFSVIPYVPDGRVKINAEILKCAEVIEFALQDQDKLAKWIMRHFADAGKRISAADAEYLAFITGGSMTSLFGEIGKVSAYAKTETVSREDIDAVVTPVLDTVAYKLTDALARRDHRGAMKLLDELLRMREAPHKLIFSISLKMRQLLSARACIESDMGKQALMDMCGIRHEFQARTLMDTARRMTLAGCRSAVLLCAETAFELNSAPEPESRLTELIVRLAFDRNGTGR